MAQRTLILLIPLVAAAVLWGTRPRPSVQEKQGATAPALPVESLLVREAPAVPPPVPAAAEALLEELDRLDSEDQAGLDRLFARMAERIAADPEGAFSDFQRNLREFPRMDLRRSFFLVETFVRRSPLSHRALKAVLDHEVFRTQPVSGHGNDLSEAQRLDRVKAFALRRFPRDAGETHDLLPRIREVARGAPSLDVAREAVLLLKALSPHPQSDVEEVLSARPPEEREVLTP